MRVPFTPQLGVLLRPGQCEDCLQRAALDEMPHHLALVTYIPFAKPVHQTGRGRVRMGEETVTEAVEYARARRRISGSSLVEAARSAGSATIPRRQRKSVACCRVAKEADPRS